MSTPTPWGEEYERIQTMLKEGRTPDTDRAQNVADALFAQLEHRLAKLPEREQRIFRYVFFETLGSKATLFQLLIDVHQGRCHTPDEAERIGGQYMDLALQS